MKPKGQHFIPRLHLEYFAGGEPKGQVWTYDAPNGKAWSAVPRETAVQTHFYSILLEDGSMDTRVETLLSEFENRAAPIYERLVDGVIPVGQQRVEFAEFLALMFARTPSMRRMYAQVIGRGLQIRQYAYAAHDGAFATLVRKLEKETGEEISQEVRDQVRQSMLDPSEYEVVVPQSMTIRALSVADKLAQLFHEMSWALLKPEHGFFITGDNPVVRQIDRRSWSPIFGDGGFENQTAQVTFPLTPKLMLLMSWKQGAIGEATIPRKYVADLNEARAAHSDRYL